MKPTATWSRSTMANGYSSLYVTWTNYIVSVGDYVTQGRPSATSARPAGRPATSTLHDLLQRLGREPDELRVHAVTRTLLFPHPQPGFGLWGRFLLGYILQTGRAYEKIAENPACCAVRVRACGEFLGITWMTASRVTSAQIYGELRPCPSR